MNLAFVGRSEHIFFMDCSAQIFRLTRLKLGLEANLEQGLRLGVLTHRFGGMNVRIWRSKVRPALGRAANTCLWRLCVVGCCWYFQNISLLSMRFVFMKVFAIVRYLFSFTYVLKRLLCFVIWGNAPSAVRVFVIGCRRRA